MRIVVPLRIKVERLFKQAVAHGWLRDAPIGKWQRRNRQSQQLVLQLMHKQGGRCGICGERFNNEWPQQITADHIIPRSKGGSNHIRNRQAAHRACDTRKGNTVIGIPITAPEPEPEPLPEVDAGWAGPLPETVSVRGLIRKIRP